MKCRREGCLHGSLAYSESPLHPRDLKDLEFELPDLDTQKELAEVLWAINDTIESYKKLISVTDELVKSQFIEMFGDPLKNPRHLLVYVRSMIRNFLRNHTCSAQISCDTNEQISLFYTGPFSFSVMWRTYTLDIVNGYFAIFDIGDGNELACAECSGHHRQ